MLTVISPAKTLDFDTPPLTLHHSTPDFLTDAQLLIERLRQLPPQTIAELMKLSDKLAGLNAARYQSWHTPFTLDNAKQAVLAFKGDVYTGLAAESFSEEDFSFAQNHLRILSGLYGVLRPLDLIQPYRLEMGTRLDNERGRDLYQFWGNRITAALNRELARQACPTLINLASNEYFKAVNPKLLQGEIITPVFKDLKNGQYKIISFYAKKARGRMSAWIIKQRITAPEQLQAFEEDGYCYNPELSKATEWVFTRDSQA